jgi:hypothetical protein
MSILLLAVGMTLVSCAGGNPSPSDQVVSVGTHHLQMHREGRAFPVVVIDAGISDNMEKLKPLQERIAKNPP